MTIEPTELQEDDARPKAFRRAAVEGVADRGARGRSNISAVMPPVAAMSFYGVLRLSGVDTYWAAFTMFTLLISALAAYEYLWRRDVFRAGGWRYLPLIGCWSAALGLASGYPVYVAILLASAGFAAFFAILLHRRPNLSIDAEAGPMPPDAGAGPSWRCRESNADLSLPDCAVQPKTR